jgi:DNA-directed RNA polymerase subunit RPC12/RpoP
MRKYRKCPHCKSKIGFEIRYTIHGFGSETKTFTGKVVGSEREVNDKIDMWASCLNCKKLIESEKLQID